MPWTLSCRLQVKNHVTHKMKRVFTSRFTSLSTGYVAVTGEEDTEYNLKVYTPYARGIYIRSPPLLRHAVMLRGNRLSSSQAFCNNRLILK